jgi:hypothetical protein
LGSHGQLAGISSDLADRGTIDFRPALRVQLPRWIGTRSQHDTYKKQSCYM